MVFEGQPSSRASLQHLLVLVIIHLEKPMEDVESSKDDEEEELETVQLLNLFVATTGCQIKSSCHAAPRATRPTTTTTIAAAVAATTTTTSTTTSTLTTTAVAATGGEGGGTKDLKSDAAQGCRAYSVLRGDTNRCCTDTDSTSAQICFTGLTLDDRISFASTETDSKVSELGGLVQGHDMTCADDPPPCACPAQHFREGEADVDTLRSTNTKLLTQISHLQRENEHLNRKWKQENDLRQNIQRQIERLKLATCHSSDSCSHTARSSAERSTSSRINRNVISKQVDLAGKQCCGSEVKCKEKIDRLRAKNSRLELELQQAKETVRLHEERLVTFSNHLSCRRGVELSAPSQRQRSFSSCYSNSKSSLTRSSKHAKTRYPAKVYSADPDVAKKYSRDQNCDRYYSLDYSIDQNFHSTHRKSQRNSDQSHSHTHHTDRNSRWLSTDQNFDRISRDAYSDDQNVRGNREYKDVDGSSLHSSDLNPRSHSEIGECLKDKILSKDK